MKLALIGHGAMGQLIERQAREAGDEIGKIMTSQDSSHKLVAELAAPLEDHDVAIDFSVGDAVLTNVKACMRAHVPLVEGTTGWKKVEADVRRIVKEHDGAFVYSANFSIGVNIFYRVIERAAQLMAPMDQYEAFIEEQHHSRKRDVPSGTALKLQELMEEQLKVDVSIASTRAGHIPGTHRVGFDSSSDQITLTHTARSREGFAAGALLAARWIVGRKGVFEFSDVIDEIMKVKSEK